MCIDNTTIVGTIRLMGISHSDIINRYTKYVWEWCIQRDIWLIPTYVCSEDNFANAPSRTLYLDGGWMPKKCIFQKTLSPLQFTPEADLFASRLNKQIDKYVSLKPDPEAFEVDAFSMSWTHLKFYAFPPLSCLSQCLQKINLQKATGIIVVLEGRREVIDIGGQSSTGVCGALLAPSRSGSEAPGRSANLVILAP